MVIFLKNGRILPWIGNGTLMGFGFVRSETWKDSTE
jgi:hypothetical protein